MAASKDRQLTIRFEKDLFDLLRVCADKDDRSVASLVRHLARRHVEAQAEKPFQPLGRSRLGNHQQGGDAGADQTHGDATESEPVPRTSRR